MSSYQDSRSDTNNKSMDCFSYASIFRVKQCTPCVAFLLGHACNTFYITVMPIGTCSLMLTLEGGIASINIQIFISSLPSLGKDPLDGTIAAKGMKKN